MYKINNFFFLMADETRDVSNREQVVVCLRWVSKHYTVQEDMAALAKQKTQQQTLAFKGMLVELPKSLKVTMLLLFLFIA